MVGLLGPVTYFQIVRVKTDPVAGASSFNPTRPPTLTPTSSEKVSVAPSRKPTPAPSTPDDLGGAALRLLHAVADCPAGGDALAAEPPASLAPLLEGAAVCAGCRVL